MSRHFYFKQIKAQAETRTSCPVGIQVEICLSKLSCLQKFFPLTGICNISIKSFGTSRQLSFRQIKNCVKFTACWHNLSVTMSLSSSSVKHAETSYIINSRAKKGKYCIKLPAKIRLKCLVPRFPHFFQQ